MYLRCLKGSNLTLNPNYGSKIFPFQLLDPISSLGVDLVGWNLNSIKWIRCLISLKNGVNLRCLSKPNFTINSKNRPKIIVFQLLDPISSLAVNILSWNLESIYSVSWWNNKKNWYVSKVSKRVEFDLKP